MIRSDHITEADEHGRRWWVIDLYHHAALFDPTPTPLDRPCGSCKGTGADPSQAWPSGDCPDCSGGRHCFDIEVDLPGWRNANRQSQATSMTHTLRVHVVPNMVLPIVSQKDDSPDNLQFVELDPDGHGANCWHEHNGELTYSWLSSLPPAAEPGMWAVQLQEVEQ